ncbi:unnamed protein product [Durusdinium trenchii]|uniref:Uncharacterized protein n=1 Tax=Durusdinium trenchii TaxID=1381693 RepID=A0ABP0NAN2_9DINO
MKTPERLKLAQQATILSKQARVAEYVPVNIDPSHLAAMPTLRLELGSPLLMTALNWLKEEGLVLDEVGGGAKLQRCGSSRQEKLESFELIGWNSLQLDLFVEDVTKKSGPWRVTTNGQELRLHDFQDPHHPARHRVQVDLGDELDAQMVDDLLLALQGYAFLPMPDDPENEAASPKGRQGYVLVGVYFSMLLVIAKVAHAKKVKAIEQHGEIKAHFSGSYGVFFLFLTTFSTVYSGYTVIGIPEEAFARGFVALRWIGATLMIVAGMLVFNPRLRRVAILRGYTSPLDFINDRYGTMRLRLLCTICGVIPIIGYITAQIVSFAAMLEGMTLGAIPKWSCMLIFCVMILTLEFLGGMNSVVLTDAIQSVVMIASFLAIPIVLAAQYGTIPSLGPPDCGFLRGVNTSAPVASAYVVPAECTVEGAGNGCMPAGCIAAVNPEFYQFPSRAVGCEIAFFLLNMLTAPLSPHFIQRTYIATSDQDLRVVMAAMLVAPFIAQIPGIVLGLTKSAYDPLFPVVDQDATAFSGLSAQLKMAGPLQYVLVTVMTCSTLAAIMSTADSAVMGASSIVSIDLLKGTLLPKLTTKQVVRAGECSSVLICALASCLGMLCSSDQLGAMMVFQGGISMQTLPAFGLGLYVPIREPAVSAGLLVGLISFPMMMLAGNPVEDYVPTVYLAALLNFLTVALVQLFTPQAPTSEKQGLTIQAIREAMVSSKEPKLSLIFLMLALAMASAPWYGVPGEEEPILFGLPRWGLFQFGAFVMMFLLGLIACFLWKPPERAAEQGSEPPKRMSDEKKRRSKFRDDSETRFLQVAPPDLPKEDNQPSVLEIEGVPHLRRSNGQSNVANGAPTIDTRSMGDSPEWPLVFAPLLAKQRVESDTAVTELHLGADEQVGSTREGAPFGLDWTDSPRPRYMFWSSEAGRKARHGAIRRAHWFGAFLLRAATRRVNLRLRHMDATSAVALVALCWGPVHLLLTNEDWAWLRGWMSSLMQVVQQVDIPKESRVEEEMLKLRLKHYQWLSRSLSHLCLVLCLHFIHEALKMPGSGTIIWAICGVGAYTQHLSIGTKVVECTPLRMKLFSYFMHILILLILVATVALPNAYKFTLLQGFTIACRFYLVFAFLDPWLTIPFQIFYTTAQIFVYLVFFQVDGAELQALCFTQFFIWGISTASSVFIDMALRGRIYAQLDSADAESLVSGFRRVLRGACDGEGLLDNHMNVAQESECLKHLILTDVSLKGRSFQHLLADDEEQNRFAKFIEASTEEFGVADSKDAACPLCFRVSLLGSAGIRVGADIYHVPVPGLFGAEEPYHIIAFKEDPESRPHPDAEEDAVPAVLLNNAARQNQVKVVTQDSKSMLSASSGHSSCFDACVELQQMTLLVDVDTELHDVEKAHLNFARPDEQAEQTADPPSALQSNMPCLRKLVKPTDWEKVRSSVVRYVDKALRDPTIPPQTLSKMTVKLPGHGGWLLVEEATVHQIPGSKKIWLLLNGFRPEKARLVPSLDGISEGIRVHQRPSEVLGR